MKEDKEKLEELKKIYAGIQRKYNLPSFQKLNEDFNIEKAVEVNTELLIREIRRFIADKLSNYLRFIEMILQPVNVPMFVFSMIKAISVEDKKKLIEAYKKLTKIEVQLIGLDLKYSEEKEAEFIKSSFELWQEIRDELSSVVEAIENNLDNKFEVNGKGYFG